MMKIRLASAEISTCEIKKNNATVAKHQPFASQLAVQREAEKRR